LTIGHPSKAVSNQKIIPAYYYAGGTKQKEEIIAV